MHSDMFLKYALDVHRAIVLPHIKRSTDITLDGNSIEASSLETKITGSQAIQYVEYRRTPMVASAMCDVGLQCNKMHSLPAAQK